MHTPFRARPRVALIGAIWATGLMISSWNHPVSAQSPSSSCGPNLIIVSTATNAFDGDSSSPAALCAHHGLDGISLFEALNAVNVAPGTQTISIVIDPSLAGQKIPASGLPVIRRDHVTISGPLGSDLKPTVTLDGQGTSYVFYIRALHVTVHGFRFQNLGDLGSAVLIRAGRDANRDGGPSQLQDIWIDQNTFVGDGNTTTDIGVSLGADAEAFAASVRDVSITRNQFSNYQGDSDGVSLKGRGSGTVIQRLTVADNVFANSILPIEFSPQDSGNKILDTRILRNTFVGNENAITVAVGGFGAGTAGGQSSGDLIDNTLISGNRFSGGTNDINIQGGYSGATSNTVSNTVIVNNVMSGFKSGVLAEGGDQDSSGNTVRGVQIINNTMASASGTGVTEAAIFNGSGASANSAGNQVSGVTITNTLFWGLGQDFQGTVSPSQVSNSVVSDPGYAGNGDINADPRFLNATTGDFHLQSGSPAINAGTSAGAPTTDFDGSLRADGHVDIGAFEFGAPSRPALTIYENELGGDGTVASNPQGISCPPDCVSNFDQGTSVTVSAHPDSWSDLVSWSDACTAGAACVVKMDGAKSVTAMFGPAPASKTGLGSTTTAPGWLATHFLLLVLGVLLILAAGALSAIVVAGRRKKRQTG